MQHTATHTFDAPIERVWAMFINPEAHIAKFESMKHRDIKVLENENNADSFHLKIERVVDFDLPGVASKVLSPTNTVITTDDWHKNDDGTCAGRWVADTIGAPVDVKGTTLLVADDDKTSYTITFDLKVKVPIIGGKIEKWARGDAETQLQAEFDAGDVWLAAHP